MLNYEEELRKFKPSLEVDQIEEAVYKEDLTDMQDIVKEVMAKKEKTVRRKKDSGGYKWITQRRSCISQIPGTMMDCAKPR